MIFVTTIDVIQHILPTNSAKKHLLIQLFHFLNLKFPLELADSLTLDTHSPQGYSSCVCVRFNFSIR